MILENEVLIFCSSREPAHHGAARGAFNDKIENHSSQSVNKTIHKECTSDMKQIEPSLGIQVIRVHPKIPTPPRTPGCTRALSSSPRGIITVPGVRILTGGLHRGRGKVGQHGSEARNRGTRGLVAAGVRYHRNTLVWGAGHGDDVGSLLGWVELQQSVHE